jgi:hypothetical protein
MDTTLLVLGNNNQWIELDLFEDLSINVIIQETDITDVEARRSPYSKTFPIPGTKNNNDFFEHFYEVNAIGYDPLTRRQCVVQYRGTDIFKGFLRLNSVIRVQDRIEYEVYILSEITDFSSIVQDKQLKELSWVGFNHIQNYDTVTQSWAADGSDTNGLFGGQIIYPMAHYGLDYQPASGQTPTFKFAIDQPDNKGIDFSGSSIPPTYFKPAMRIKTILNKIFEESGYEIVSNFFESEYFKGIYMDLAMNAKLGVEVASARTNQNIFRVYGNPLPQAQEFSFANGVTQQIRMGRISSTDGYDPSFNFNEQYSAYQIPYSGQYSFEFKGKVNQRYSNNSVATYYGISIFKASRPEDLSNPSRRIAVTGTPDNLLAFNYSNSNNIRIFLNNVSLNTGDYVGLFIRFNQSNSSNRNAGLWVGPTDWIGFGARWELYNSPQFTTSDFVDMKLQFPEISCLDYVKAIVKMFNLVVVQTEGTKKIRIEPLSWYYSQNFAQTKDWTQILDKNEAFKIEPVNFQLKKEYDFRYLTADEEHLGKIYEDENDEVFGTKRFIATTDILTGKVDLEFPFRPYPSNVMTGSTNLVIPMVYKLDVATNKEVPYSNKNHIFFWCGNRYFYADQTKTIQKSWYLTSGATPIQWTTYPCVNHLSSLDKQDPELISDLNFDKTDDFFARENQIIQQFTANNIYQLWYGDYFTNLYSPETRRVTGKFIFEPIQISQINLTDKIFLKDSLFSIERINEADLVNWKATEVSLIKLVSPYNKIVPPAPTYNITPNQSYPPSGASFSITGYVSNNQSEVCFNTASIFSLFASSDPVVEGTFVYYNNTGSMPLQQGTFFKQTTTSQTFVAINNLGSMTENQC